MNFQVPQFIEVEDKIFGPLTFKQFVYLAGGGGAIFLLYISLPIWLSIWAILAIAALVLALAFYKVNNRPFIAVLEAAFKYLFTFKLYLWKHQNSAKTGSINAPLAPTPSTIAIPKLSESKLRDLSWSLDIKERVKK